MTRVRCRHWDSRQQTRSYRRRSSKRNKSRWKREQSKRLVRSKLRYRIRVRRIGTIRCSTRLRMIQSWTRDNSCRSRRIRSDSHCTRNSKLTSRKRRSSSMIGRRKRSRRNRPCWNSKLIGHSLRKMIKTMKKWKYLTTLVERSTQMGRLVYWTSV